MHRCASVQNRTWAEIDLGALQANAAQAKKLAGDDMSLLAVVKADAYGHGLERVARCLTPQAACFGVAAISEARILQCVLEGRVPILLLGALLPEEREEAVRQGWHLSISTPEEAAHCQTIAAACGSVAQLHLVADTGMGRMGALQEEFAALCAQAAALARVRVRGLASHLPSADEDHAFTETQLTRFFALARGLMTSGPDGDGAQLHVMNSAGLLRYRPLCGGGGLFRAGLMLYGVAPETEFQPGLRPVMSLKTRVRLVRMVPAGHGVSYGRTFVTRRPTRVATLGIGYGDGYRRSLSGRGADILIHGQRCPVIGRVTMDQTMVDTSDLQAEVVVGDEAVCIGGQGGETITMTEIAQKADTIPWEIMTGITQRVERVYLSG